MIGSDLKGAVLESGMASLVNGDLAAVRAASQGTITIRATGETQPACLRQLLVHVLRDLPVASVRSRTNSCRRRAGCVSPVARIVIVRGPVALTTAMSPLTVMALKAAPSRSEPIMPSPRRAPAGW